MALSKEVKPILHYALESIPSIYDEEALTALQLVGRVARNLNELIQAFQDLSRGTANTLAEFESETIPTEVNTQIQNHITNGDFDKAIDLYCGELRARLNNILTGGSADKDAEIVDARMDHRGHAHGQSWATLGEMLRFWLGELEANLNAVITWQTEPVTLDMILGYVNTDGEFVKENLATHKCATVDVVPGERYRVKNSYGFNMPSFIVQDKDHYPLMVGDVNDGATVHSNYDKVITMPAQARYLIINSMNGYFAGLQRVIGVNSNALDGDYITNALSGVLAGPLVQTPVAGKKVLSAHALKNGVVVALDSGDTSHRVARYNVQEGKAYNLKTAVSFGCNPYVFYNKAGSIIDKLVVGPEDTTQEYNVKVRAPIGAAEMLVYFTGNYETKLTVDNGCKVEVPETPASTGSGYPDWSHLKWYAMGDSLTEANAYTDKHYYDYIQEKTGIQVIVDGVGGTGYLAGQDEGKSFMDRVGNIPADVDVITLFGSGNDLGLIADDGWDALNATIVETLLSIKSHAPCVPIICFPSIPWRGYAGNSMEVETLSYKMLDHALGVCDSAGVVGASCVNTLTLCPFNSNDDAVIAMCYTKDPTGIHPDENGHRLIAPFFYNALSQALACK